MDRKCQEMGRDTLGGARLLILRAWTTVPRPLLLGYTFQSLTRYKGDRFRSWLRPSVPISKGLYTHRGNRPHICNISADETGLAWSEGWFGRVDSDPDPSEFSAVGIQTERVGLERSRARWWTDHPHPPDREQLGAAIAEIQKVCYEWCVYGHCCGRGQRPDGSATGVVNPLVRAIVRPRPSRHTNSV